MYCIPSTEEIFRFCHIKNKSNISESLGKPSPSLVKLINQLNNFTDKIKDYDENLSNYKYSDLVYFQNFSEKFKSKSLSLLHLNIGSLSKNLMTCILFKEININFDIIAFTESRNKRIQFPQ